MLNQLGDQIKNMMGREGMEGYTEDFNTILSLVDQVSASHGEALTQAQSAAWSAADATLVDIKAQYETDAAALTAQITEKDQKITEAYAKVDQAYAERDQKLELLNSQLVATIEAYRAAILKADPELPADMVMGGSIEEIDASAGKAKELVERIKATITIPTGAGARGVPDTSAMSAGEKIRAGLQR